MICAAKVLELFKPLRNVPRQVALTSEAMTAVSWKRYQLTIGLLSAFQSFEYRLSLLFTSVYCLGLK